MTRISNLKILTKTTGLIRILSVSIINTHLTNMYHVKLIEIEKKKSQKWGCTSLKMRNTTPCTGDAHSLVAS